MLFACFARTCFVSRCLHEAIVHVFWVFEMVWDGLLVALVGFGVCCSQSRFSREVKLGKWVNQSLLACFFDPFARLFACNTVQANDDVM